MIYTREKIVLAMNYKFGGFKNKTFLQKHMFLFINENKSDLSDIVSLYDFIPYYYGCYSFQLESDKARLVKKNLIPEEINKETTNDIKLVVDELPIKIIKLIDDYYLKYKDISLDNIIKKIYQNYNYYTINSEIKDKYLSQEQVDEISECYQFNNDKTIFTLGYEGLSIDTYINKLIQNNIKALIDVRFNPYSRKYGFSKTFLLDKLTNLKIKYFHIPELGIRGEKRLELDMKDISSYDNLFHTYEQELHEKRDYICEILLKLKQYNRVALTCFEKDVCYCHRGKIIDYIKQSGDYKVKHI